MVKALEGAVRTEEARTRRNGGGGRTARVRVGAVSEKRGGAGIPGGLGVRRGGMAAETGGGAPASSAAAVAKMGSLTASI